ncbi:unnamed protein product [Closterium sp. Yama58-4]|nr:unnamed protein product [Closterium sp. Yama58-4]
MTKAAYGDARRALSTTTGGGSKGGAASEKVNARRALTTTPSTPGVQVATAVVVGKTRLDFTKQVCVSVAKKARRKSATVWWKGGGDSGSASAGGQCAQVKFFGKSGCKGPALDSVPNPLTPGFPSTAKDIRKWSSVASVLCDDPIDSGCAALGCDPDGSCQLDQSGELFCQWASSCGTCPRGSTCTQKREYIKYIVNMTYCACPDGYGLTPRGCYWGNELGSSFSFTVIADPTAKDKASRPYTFRLNSTGCTQLPDAVAGKATFVRYLRDTGNGGAPCARYRIYPTDNCKGTVFEEYVNEGRLGEYASELTPGTVFGDMRSALCIPQSGIIYLLDD